MSAVRAEGEGKSVAGARWAAVRKLEAEHPDADVEAVEFETLEESSEEGGNVRVAAIVRDSQSGPTEEQTSDVEEPAAERSIEDESEPESNQAESEDVVDAAAEPEPEERDPAPPRPRSSRKREADGEWPAEPSERLTRMLEEIVDAFELDAKISVSESEEQLSASIEGEDLGLLIGRHGQTIDAIQLISMQAAFRGRDERKRVVVDAEGYRERRAEILERQADRAVSDALRYERPVELDAMSSQERKVVHNYLKDHSDVETYSEGDEPYRRIVISPLAGVGDRAD